VTVNELTTATASVTALPDGRLSQVTNINPVRVRSGSGWVPVTTTLTRQADGSWSPSAIPGDAVRFSGGGTGPLATISAAGASLSLTWPTALPAPVVSGSSATYRDALPGIDLVLTATSDQAGGFSEVLAVHNATAARNPALAQLLLGVSGRGTHLSVLKSGALAAASAGRGVFAAPPPMMWDSGSAAPDSAALAAASRAARLAGTTVAPAGSGAASSPSGPATGAQLAPVRASVVPGGTALRLAPDTRMLTSGATRWPVFIDPSFTWYASDAAQQAYDILQSGCPTAGHFNDGSYTTLLTGYDGWEGCNPGTGFVFGYNNAYYRMGVPSSLWGANINSATFNNTEYYASACQNAYVTVSLTAAIGPSTTWNNQPGISANLSSVNTGFVSGDCGTSNNGAGQGYSWNVLPAVTDAVSHHWSQITFRLWEDGNCPSSCIGGNGDGSKYDLRRFSHQASQVFIQAFYNFTPDVPGHLKATANSDGSGSVGCDTNATDSSMPLMGKTASVHGPYLWASFSDRDTDTVNSTVQYWNNATPGTTFTISAGSGLSTGQTPVAAQIPASFTASMSDGTVIGWRAQASDGHFTSGWSSKCFFKMYPDGPDAPTLSAVSGTAAVGSQVSVTITAPNAAADPPQAFVWGLDRVPPTAGPIPASQKCTSTAQSGTCSAISNGVATLTVTVPSPGPHDIWVYEVDAAGNDSGLSNGAPAGGTVTFTAAADPPVSFASGTSLQANFAAALGAAAPYDNTMISNGGSSCGSGADGSHGAFSASELKAAGWTPGGKVTVDGTTFTLPSFGSCGADNLLAANRR
jgi:hypothetical protein